MEAEVDLIKTIIACAFFDGPTVDDVMDEFDIDLTQR